jgi:hypothetical protein
VVALGAGLAAVVNVVVHAGGRAAGGTFRFTAAGQPAEVDAVTVAGFSAVPLLLGLTAVALLSRYGTWVRRAALIVAPVLAIGTILVLTLPADFDTTSKTTLALCHLTLVPISILAVTALTRPRRTAVGTA